MPLLKRWEARHAGADSLRGLRTVSPASPGIFCKEEGEEVEDEQKKEQHDFILGLDYSRICCLLWGVCKNQEKRIRSLEKIINK